MKKFKDFFGKVPRWLKVAVPLVLIAFIALFVVIASIPKSYPEGAIVQGRNESYGIYYNKSIPPLISLLRLLKRALT